MSVGYPLLKQIAQYWIHELVPDQYFNDGTLVAAPCNSPEHGNIVSPHEPYDRHRSTYKSNHLQTFGCTHYQTLIWEVFDHIIEGWDASGDTNSTFLQMVKDTQKKMDKGIHIGWYGQIQGNYI
jgi:alpha-L-fucosidase 2